MASVAYQQRKKAERAARRRQEQRALRGGLVQAHAILHGSFWTRLSWAILQPVYRWRASRLRRRILRAGRA